MILHENAVAAADLPAGVTYDAEVKVHVDDDDDPTTPAANDDDDADETDTPVRDAPTYFVDACDTLTGKFRLTCST